MTYCNRSSERPVALVGWVVAPVCGLLYRVYMPSTTTARVVSTCHLGDVIITLKGGDVYVTTDRGSAHVRAADARSVANHAYHLIGETDSWLDYVAERHRDVSPYVPEGLASATNVRCGRCPDGCCGMGVDVMPETPEQITRLADIGKAAEVLRKAFGL